jgi:hypothetical protein
MEGNSRIGGKMINIIFSDAAAIIAKTLEKLQDKVNRMVDTDLEMNTTNHI